MKAVKSIICCLSALLIFFIPLRAPVHARADSSYARADARDIYFCKDKNSTALFAIPYTYCVEIISADGEWYYVRYGDANNLYEPLYGYCKSENLTPVDEPPENKFLFYTVPLTFRTDSYGNSLPAENELTVNSAFYGTYYSGGFAYSYVRYNGNFYYTSGANDGYPLNEIPSQNVDGPPPSAPDGSPSTEKIIIAVVIACVAAGALVGAYITSRRARYFRPDK